MNEKTFAEQTEAYKSLCEAKEIAAVEKGDVLAADKYKRLGGLMKVLLLLDKKYKQEDARK